MKSKFTPDTYISIFLLFSILAHYVFPVLKIIPFPYSLAGFILLFAGILLVFRTNMLLSENKTSIQPFVAPTHLITSGPFRFSRNPVYLGMAVALFGVELLFGTLTPFIFPVLFVIFIQSNVITDEEKMLEDAFGQSYLDYKSKIRRWI